MGLARSKAKCLFSHDQTHREGTARCLLTRCAVTAINQSRRLRDLIAELAALAATSQWKFHCALPSIDWRLTPSHPVEVRTLKQSHPTPRFDAHTTFRPSFSGLPGF